MRDAVAAAEHTDLLVPGTPVLVAVRLRSGCGALFVTGEVAVAGLRVPLIQRLVRGVVARDSAASASALLRDPGRRVVVLLDGGERHAARGEVVRAA